MRRKLLRNPRISISLAFILLVILAAVLAPVLATQDPLVMEPVQRLQGPSQQFILGTDEFGRDVWSRMLYGARITLPVAFIAVAVAAAVGTAMGVLAGYYRGWIEIALMRSIDVILSFPAILMAIAVVAFLGQSLRNVILTIAILYSPTFARIAYASTLRVRELEFVEAARALGARDWRIFFRAILPNIAAPLMVQASLSLGFAILLESGLSFLGLGPPPPAPSWGRMVASGREFMDHSVTLVIVPSVTVAATILAFNLLGDGLRDELDPRLKT